MNDANATVRQAIENYATTGYDWRKRAKLVAAYCRRHDIVVLRADCDNRVGADRFRKVTAYDVNMIATTNFYR